MLLIRTAEALARALAEPLDPELKHALTIHRDRLVGYPLEEIAEFLVVEPLDRLTDVEEACGRLLVGAEGVFLLPIEWIVRHSRYYEVGWIISDDGYGLVMFVNDQPGAHPMLLSACETALAQAARR